MKRRRILAVLILLLFLFLGGYMIFTAAQLAKIYREYPPEVPAASQSVESIENEKQAASCCLLEMRCSL